MTNALTDPPKELRHRVRATAEELAAPRTALAAWLAGAGMSRERQEEIVLAAYEAMANAAEHAYVGRPEGGELELRAWRDGSSVTVAVADQGRWKPAEPSGGIRGRGLLLIRGLAHRSEVTRGDGGTTVTMTWSLGPDGP